MLTSRIDAFTDQCAYRDAMQSAEVGVLLTGRGDFRAELTRVDLNGISLESGQETLPRVGRGAVKAQRSVIYFLLGTAQAGAVHCGVDFSPGEILVMPAGSTYHHVTSAGCRWADVSFSPEDLAAAASSLGGQLASFPRHQIVRPRPLLMSRLAKLHGAASGLARTAPDRLARPEVARAMEQSLIHAIVSCLIDPKDDRSCPANRRHRTLLARFEGLLAERSHEPLHLAEICAAVGAPERTLRAVCRQHLGMGPIRFLWLRRMHLAREELLRAAETSATVTSIATGQGFWELGKFSVAYRSLFRESPSATLRRRKGDRAPPKKSPFALPFAVSA